MGKCRVTDQCRNEMSLEEGTRRWSCIESLSAATCKHHASGVAMVLAALGTFSPQLVPQGPIERYLNDRREGITRKTWTWKWGCNDMLHVHGTSSWINVYHDTRTIAEHHWQVETVLPRPLPIIIMDKFSVVCLLSMTNWNQWWYWDARRSGQLHRKRKGLMRRKDRHIEQVHGAHGRWRGQQKDSHTQKYDRSHTVLFIVKQIIFCSWLWGIAICTPAICESGKREKGEIACKCQTVNGSASCRHLKDRRQSIQVTNTLRSTCS